MSIDVDAYQTHWHSDELLGIIPQTLDTYFLFGQWDMLEYETLAAGEGKHVLDVACGDARDIAFLTHAGWEAWGLDPSRRQLEEARKAHEKAARPINLVCGVAEWLPFRPGVFDALTCKSALDHFVDRDAAMREFARVLRPEGRAVVSINNYASLGTRLSRMLYRLYRLVWPPARGRRLLWDSPVPEFHMYEYTFQNTLALGRPQFDEIRSYGVSLLWGVPGWGRLLSTLPTRISQSLLTRLDRLARSRPSLADVCVFVWRPKARPPGRESEG